MKVKVKLYGTLGIYATEYNTSQGIEVVIPDGTTVKGLLAHLENLMTRRVVVIAGGRVLKADDEVQDGSSLDIFQSIQGG